MQAAADVKFRRRKRMVFKAEILANRAARLLFYEGASEQGAKSRKF